MSEDKRPVQPLGEHAAAALAAYGDRAGLSGDAKAALRARISASVVAGAQPQVEAAPVIDTRRSALRIGVALAAAAAVLLAIRFVAFDSDGAVRQGAEGAPQAAYGAQHDDAGGQASSRAPETEATPGPAMKPGAAPVDNAPAVDDTPEPAPLEDVDQLETSATPLPEAAAPAAVDREPKKVRRKPAAQPQPKPQPEPAPVDTTLAAEMKLMRSARAALRKGDPDAALRHLSRHATEFSRGQMVEDRQALRVQALCDAGRADEARTAAQAFVRAHPGSLHASRVTKICEKN